jgi:hypothetical protein
MEESIPEYQAVDDKEGVVLNLDSLGDIWRQNGELALAEFANKTKRGSQAQMELRALQKSADSKGFGLISRNASQESSVLGKSIGAM